MSKTSSNTRAESAETGKPMSTRGHSDDATALLGKLLEIVEAIKHGDTSSKLFPSGVEVLEVKAEVGSVKFELTLSGATTAQRAHGVGMAGLAMIDADLAALLSAVDTLLPQVSGNGYYPYSPSERQYGTKASIGAVVDVGRQWQHSSMPAFGVGDISFKQGGNMPPHTTGHRLGKNIDVRPMRIDGAEKPVTWQSAEYSRERTQLLVDNFRAHSNCTKIFFNDPNINGVQPLEGHDNHLHVEMNA